MGSALKDKNWPSNGATGLFKSEGLLFLEENELK